MSNTKFVGTGVALVTPFNADGAVDYDGLTNLINHVTEGGVEYLVALGTTAESATLNAEEKKKVVAHILEVNNGELPVVLGMGSNNTAAVVEQIKNTDFTGIDAILSVSPYYNKPTQEGIYQHFKAVSEASPVDIILYNVPGRTSSNMDPSTVIRLANDFENIIGIKEAKGDIVQAMELIKNRPDDFLIISGDDMITLPMVLCGGDGVISVIGEGFPRTFSDMVRHALRGELSEAQRKHYKLTTMTDLIFAEGNPGGIKAVLKELDVCGDTMRLPLVNISDELYATIQKEMKQL